SGSKDRISSCQRSLTHPGRSAKWAPPRESLGPSWDATSKPRPCDWARARIAPRLSLLHVPQETRKALKVRRTPPKPLAKEVKEHRPFATAAKFCRNWVADR